MKPQSLMLLFRDGQEDAIIDGNRACKEGSGVSSGDGDVTGIAAESRSRRLGGGGCPVARLERNPSGLRSAIGCTETSVADKDLTIAAIVAVDGVPRLRRTLIRRMARR